MNHLTKKRILRICPLLFAAVLILSCVKPAASGARIQSSGTAEPTVSASKPPETPEPLQPSEIPETPSGDVSETEAPIETQTPAPTVPPVSDEQLDEGYLDGWFDGSVLVGDSLVAGLSGYVTAEKDKGHPCLGNMQLVGASALTLKKALGIEKHEREAELKYRTYYMNISGVVDAVQADRLFIMLGVSDLRWYTADELIAVYGEMLELIKEDHPGIRIYIHSLMPMLKDYAKQVGLDCETHKAANEKLRAFCEENGYTYLELADLVRDDEGYLKYEYSAEDYRFHLNRYGKAIWVRLLRTCARDDYYAGIWKPEDDRNE